MSEPRPESQPAQQQEAPGASGRWTRSPTTARRATRAHGRLTGKAAVITGGDSGIGRAVAIAFAREGADVLISYLNEHDDAKDTARYVEEAGRKCVLVPGDISDRAHAKTIIPKAVEEFGKVDILVNNAAFQMSHDTLDEVTDDEWDHTVAANLTAMFMLVQGRDPAHAAGRVDHQLVVGQLGHAEPEPRALRHDQGGDRQLHRVAGADATPTRASGRTASRPGPIWTPLIPATMPEEKVESFGEQVPLGRAGQPAELAPVYVLLASDESSYVSGARVAVTGGNPIL